MATLLYTHDICLEHDTGPAHPESGERLRALLKTLSGAEFDGLVRRTAPRAERSQLGRVHNMKFISDILSSMPKTDRVDVDFSGTVISPKSDEAALRAAGAVCAAVDAVVKGEAKNAFCAVRPPGHHAEPNRTMGFCLFNNVAVGAFHAREAHGIERIAVVDFDVHHGNGTETMLRGGGAMLFASIHQAFLFPHSHKANNTDHGNIINIGLTRNTKGGAFRDAFEARVLARLDEFKPDFLLVSAGFDAHLLDPVGGMKLNDQDYGWISEALVDAARRHCGGRLVSVLEGGYHPNAVASAGAIHVKALMAA